VREPRRDQRGQVTVMIIGFALILLMAVGVTVDASAAYLARQSLATLADGAALAGADQLQGGAAYEGGLAEHVPIDVTTARASVAEHLRVTGAYADHPGLVAAVDVVGDRVVVRLTAPLDLPIRVDGITATTVGARGSATVVLAR
jgi:Flp pilus assembly protein TadG